MKTIWTIIATLAIANVIAIGGLIAWLSATDRLNGERIDRVRELFRPTLAAEEHEAAAEKAKAAQAAVEQAEQERLAAPPEDAATRIARQEETEQVRLQHILKREQEQRALRESLDRMRQELEREQKKLVEERKAFDDYRKRLADTEGAEQFRKALDTLQGQKPKDAKDVLQALIQQSNIEQVVSYLGAMDDRVRSKVIAEFVKADAQNATAVAADLLERLRTRGVALPPPSPQAAAAGDETEPR